jgi:hypothetical protein
MVLRSGLGSEFIEKRVMIKKCMYIKVQIGPKVLLALNCKTDDIALNNSLLSKTAKPKPWRF